MLRALESVTGVSHDEPVTNGARWAGLLRAVNVGGRTLTMAALRQSATDAGFTDVTTLLASGNLIFTATGPEAAVRERLEQAISADAGFTVEVLLRSKEQLASLLATNPFPGGNGSQVLIGFLDGPAPAGLGDAMAPLVVDEEFVLAGCELWAHFPSGMGRSKLAAKLPALARPRVLTGRNLNTVTKLAGLL